MTAEECNLETTSILSGYRTLRPAVGHCGGILLARADGMRLVFDRGTVLLLDATSDIEVADLPGMLWDPRVGAYRAPAWRHREVATSLARGGVRFADEVNRGEAPGAWREVDLRGYQREALDAWSHAGRRGLIVLPTGSGKTRVGIAAMAQLGVSTLCLVPTRVPLWRRRSGAGSGHRLHVRERVSAHGRAGESLRTSRDRRGAPLRSRCP